MTVGRVVEALVRGLATAAAWEDQEAVRAAAESSPLPARAEAVAAAAVVSTAVVWAAVRMVTDLGMTAAY